MLICKLFLRTFIHKVSDIIFHDCQVYYSDTEAILQVQIGKCSKTKNARASRKITSAGNFITQIICSMCHLKEKQKKNSIIIRHVTTEKRPKGIFMLQKGVG